MQSASEAVYGTLLAHTLVMALSREYVPSERKATYGPSLKNEFSKLSTHYGHYFVAFICLNCSLFCGLFKCLDFSFSCSLSLPGIAPFEAPKASLAADACVATSRLTCPVRYRSNLAQLVAQTEPRLPRPHEFPSHVLRNTALIIRSDSWAEDIRDCTSWVGTPRVLSKKETAQR